MRKSGRYFRGLLAFVVLTALAGPASEVLGQTGRVAIVTNRYANIRGGPGTNFTRLGRAHAGDRFPVSQVRQEWVEITYQGRTAWVFRELVRLERTGPSREEIDRVQLKVEDLNNRLESLAGKLEKTRQLLQDRLPEEPEPDTAVGPRAEKVRRPVDVSPAWAFVPGGGRIASGDWLRGWGMFGLTAACAGTGYYYHDRFRDYQSDYRALPVGADPAEYDRLYREADHSRRVSDALFYAAGAMYALNLIDYFFLLPREAAGIEMGGEPAGEGRIKLSLGKEF